MRRSLQKGENVTKLHIALCPREVIEAAYGLSTIRPYIPLTILDGKKMPDDPILALARVIGMRGEQVLLGKPPTQVSLCDTDNVCIIASPSTHKIDGIKHHALQLSRLPAIQMPLGRHEVGGRYGVRCSIQDLQERAKANVDIYLPFQQGKKTHYFRILFCSMTGTKLEVVVETLHGHTFTGIVLSNDKHSCCIKL